MRRPQRRYQLPPLVSHPLDDEWSVIVPIARTNLVTNPSFETNTTNWTAVGGSIGRTISFQRRGSWSLSVAPSAGVNADGVYYGTVSLTSGTTYAYSLDIRGAAGVKYQLYIATTGGVALTTKQFTATGYWQRVALIYTETSTTTRRLYVTKVSSDRADTFYIDGVQLEACAAGEAFDTTYIDGDQAGLLPNQHPPAYLWNGTPHASTSSRSVQTRAGGRIVPFREYGWAPLAIVGLGLAPPDNQAIEYAVLDGGQDQATRKPSRQFTLVGRFSARTYGRLRNRGSLAALLDRDLSGLDQPLILRYQAMDGTTPIGEEGEVVCKYQGGLEGNTDGHFGQDAPLTFVQRGPSVRGTGDSGAVISAPGTLANANLIVYRSPGGAWSALGTGITGTDVFAVTQSAELGGVFVGGSFTDAGGSGADNIALWSGTAWSVVGSATAINARVRAIVRAPNGNIYVAGEFTNAGGVAAADFIALWNGSAWAAVGASGANNTIYALAIAPNGDLYAGGSFTDIGGSGADYIARWDGSAWNTVGGATALNSDVYALAIDAAGNVYVGGDFTNAGGVADADRIAKWDGSAWTALSTGMNAFVDALAIGANGILYAGGTFTTAGGLSISYIAQWNGVTWAAVGSGVNNQVNSLAIAPDSTLYASGTFTTAGGVTVPDGTARWNGSAWVLVDIDFPGTPTVYIIRPMPDGSLYIGYNTTGSASTAFVEIITNPGTGHAYPVVVLRNATATARRIYQLHNYTTGRAIYLNLTLLPGETATLRFEPDNLSFTSDFRGNIAYTILPGSNEADFFLQPGANSMSYFGTSVLVGAAFAYRAAYLSLDDL